MAASTQYIFNLYWYTHADRAPTLNDDQIQDVPEGGWDKWSLAHNIDWLHRKMEEGAKFVLIGNRDQLRAQAENVGTGNNDCTVGIEVLTLLRGGYIAREPNPSNADERGVSAVRVFEYGGTYSNEDYVWFCEYAKAQTNTSWFYPHGFWTPEYKEEYLVALD